LRSAKAIAQFGHLALHHQLVFVSPTKPRLEIGDQFFFSSICHLVPFRRRTPPSWVLAAFAAS